jgi:ankyrin repeat protein
LQLAAQKNVRNLVKLLLGLGADINGPAGEDGFTLHYAIYSGDKTMVEFFLEAGVNVDDSVRGNSILVKAVRMGLSEMVPILLEKGRMSARWSKVTPLLQRHTRTDSRVS